MLAKKIQQSLEQAGVAINGSQPWDIQVHDKRWFRRVLLERNLGLGESYMDGWWDSDAFLPVLKRTRDACIRASLTIKMRIYYGTSGLRNICILGQA